MLLQETRIVFPAYFMKGERIEFDGKTYVVPEPVACQSLKELVIFLYDKCIRPFREHPPR